MRSEAKRSKDCYLHLPTCLCANERSVDGDMHQEASCGARAPFHSFADSVQSLLDFRASWDAHHRSKVWSGVLSGTHYAQTDAPQPKSYREDQ